MKKNCISYTILVLFGFVIVTSGCLGVFTSDGPPSQFNVTFEEPTTGTVFSDMSYSAHTHNQLIYSVENISDEKPFDRLQYYEKRDNEWDKFHEENYTSKNMAIYISGPVSKSNSPRQYQIQALNETDGVIDQINVTVRKNS